MSRRVCVISLFFSCLFFVTCDQVNPSLFQQIKPEQSGLHFNNEIIESDTFNILTEQYIYNGGGVGIGDFNNDGLQDIYFTGNAVSNKLFLNKGDFKFDDITAIANVGAEENWSSGVAVVDINNDGWQDLYVGATINKQAKNRINKLFVNQGLNKDGVPTFKEEAESYGIADDGHTSNAIFFDYDLDGDLDLYVLTNVMQLKRTTSIKKTLTDGSSATTDRLYRNNGNGTFTNVSNEAGILIEGFGLGIAVMDVNKDNYPDLFISNDFVTEDILYLNNQDGTFTDRLDDYLKHGSYSSMGIDAADINSDGHLDFMTLDMLPYSNQRIKQMVGGNNYVFYDMMQRNGYEVQHVRNCLQINNGGEGFSDVSQLTGMDKTDWSWSILFADYDNDGNRDAFITNGFPRDITDMDFSDFRSGREGRFTDNKKLLPSIPEVKIRNYIYQNKGNLAFEDVSKKWGIDIPSFSNGAAYADLDNDGDLDYVINNINDPAFLFKNNSTSGNSIQFQLEGPEKNRTGIGSKIWLELKDKTEYVEVNPYRGYIASVDPRIHFGLGEEVEISSVKIQWPDGKVQNLSSLEINSIHTLKYVDAKQVNVPKEQDHKPSLFEDLTEKINIPFVHSDKNFMDFRIQVLLPKMHSQEGPGIAVGDINGDQLEDFVIGNAQEGQTKIFIQKENNTFVQDSIDNFKKDNTALLLFDLENDGDLDLYIGTGSSEYKVNSPELNDQIYKNDGRGNFTLAENVLPDNFNFTSTVNATDFDQDGDLDLFVGGRMVPQSYPMPETSTLLRNDNGRFTDVTKELAPDLINLGMVTSALWTDYNQDGWQDLIVVGEWMPITFIKNTNGKFSLDKTIKNSNGWWNSIASGDMDSDGDLDYVLGNQGLNNQLKATAANPVEIVAKDFDANGSVDHIINHFNGENYYPYHLKKDLIKQLNFMRKRYQRFEEYAVVQSDELLTAEESADTYQGKAFHFESMYLENTGNGNFAMHSLPVETQFSPIKGIQIADFNADGNLDILTIGNDYGTEIFTGRHDASIGNLLQGDGKGSFAAISIAQSGWKVDGDARALVQLYNSNDDKLILASQNAGPLKVFQHKNNLKLIPALPDEHTAWLYDKEGNKTIKEIPYGSGYFSQSSRMLEMDTTRYSKIEFVNFKNKKRTVE